MYTNEKKYTKEINYTNEKCKYGKSIRMKISIRTESILMKSMPTEDSIERKKKPSNVFLTKLNEKGTQPNKNAVLADSKCT